MNASKGNAAKHDIIQRIMRKRKQNGLTP